MRQVNRIKFKEIDIVIRIIINGIEILLEILVSEHKVLMLVYNDICTRSFTT